MANENKKSSENASKFFKNFKLDLGKSIILPAGEEIKEISVKDSVKELYTSDDEALKEIEHITPTDLEASSNERYYKTVEDVVEVAKEQLKNQNKDKDKIRNIFIWFFIALLSFQMIAVILFMTLTAVESVKFAISDALMTTFIVSVFVETLGAIVIMITFAFASKEELTVVELLTQVVKNFQKYKRNDSKQEEGNIDSGKNIHIHT